MGQGNAVSSKQYRERDQMLLKSQGRLKVATEFSNWVTGKSV